jgi:hypothetical protein
VISSFGDRIELGVYPCHSRFGRVVNFSGPEALVSLVSEEVGPGPTHIVLAGDFRALAEGFGDTLVIGRDFVSSGCYRWGLDPDRRYRSELDGPWAQAGAGATIQAKLGGNLGALRSALALAAPPKSLPFLLEADGELAGGFDSPTEREMAARFRSGLDEFARGRPLEGAARLRGLGFGLTPSGDDFLLGYLSGLQAWKALGLGEGSGLAEALFLASLGENPFTNTALRAARAGSFPGHVKRLLEALVMGGELETREATLGLLSHGETSGADFAAGLWTALQERTDRCRQTA